MSDLYAVPNKLPGKQVSVLAHRRRRLLQKDGTSKQKRKQRIERFKKRPRQFRRAESFLMSQIKAERTENRFKQILRRTNILKEHTDSNQKLLVVFRHAGAKIHDETTNKILNSLRLRVKNQVVFMKNDKEAQLLLKVVEPYVIYGHPTVTIIRELIFKKGFARIEGRKQPIESNTMIEEHLGEHGIICLEDIIHEIFTVGENFEVVKNFLCPFQLIAPRNGYEKKVSISYKRGGEYGYRGDKVTALLEQCF